MRRPRTACCSRSPTAQFKKRYIYSERIAGMSDILSHTKFVIPAPATPSVAVSGSDARFPVRRIFCVGRNYAGHAREMGKAPDREPPFFFMKPADAVVAAEGTVPYPSATSDLHHEVEMVVALSGGGRDITPQDALA